MNIPNDNSRSNKGKIGRIQWFDLTVTDAKKVKDFYQHVVGWGEEKVNMGGYDDYCMVTNHTQIAGICHKEGENADLPSQWLIYITVENLRKSLQLCEDNEGKILTPIKDAGDGMFAVIQDPSGAVCALYEEKEKK